LSPEEQRVLRLAVNRLAEKGEWDLDALKIEFDELIVTDAPIEITIASCAATRPILRFLLDYWKAMLPPVSS
jgi:hypothetical protein